MVFNPIPTKVETVLDPDWLSQALDDIATTDRVVAVEAVDSLKTVAEKLRLRVTVVGADGSRRTSAYCVKGHLDGSSGASLVNEARFYRDLAPHLDVGKPRVHYVAVDEEAVQAIVVMEDVIANGGTFLSAHSPYSLDRARDTLGQLARLHAATWGDDKVTGLPWLAPRVAEMSQHCPTETLQVLLDDGRADGFRPELRDANAVTEALLLTAAHDVTCIIHGDSHSGNAYLDGHGRSCWLDWQIVQAGSWATDISYHLATVLEIGDRRAHEAELLRHYLGELQGLGVQPPPWEQAWELYTLSFSYAYFLWAITRISSRAVVLIHMRRLAAALADHDTFGRLGVAGPG